MIGSFPTAYCRSVEQFDEGLTRIASALCGPMWGKAIHDGNIKLD